MTKSLLETNKISLEGFDVIGFSDRTTNVAEMNGVGIIPAMNMRFFGERLLEMIPNRKNLHVVALYTNYESDETGEYDYVLGAEVSNEIPASDDMKLFKIPSQNYMVFTTRKGPLQEVVLEAWQYIWEWSKNNNRAFGTDFELYDERSVNPESGQADIYISIK